MNDDMVDDVKVSDYNNKPNPVKIKFHEDSASLDNQDLNARASTHSNPTPVAESGYDKEEFQVPLEKKLVSVESASA